MRNIGFEDIKFEGVKLEDPVYDKWHVNYDNLVKWLNDNDKYPEKNKNDSCENDLFKWVSAQKKKYKEKKLLYKYFDKLEGINFIWSKKEYDFKLKIDSLIKWFSINNKYPEQYSNDKNEEKIYSYIKDIRIKRKKGILSKKYEISLNNIGFIWNQKEYDFKLKVDKLKNWIEKNNKYPSQKSKNIEEKSLAIFAQDNRSKKRQSKLNKNYEDILNKINFIWDPYENKWDTRFLEVSSFFEKYGKLPSIYGDNEKEKKLGEWLTTQKELIKDNKFKENRVLKMNSLGINISKIEDDKKNEIWIERFTALKKIKDNYGRWPTSKRNNKEETLLITWLSKQRKDYKKGKLKSVYKEKMDTLGEWKAIHNQDNFDDSWINKFNSLSIFVDENKRFPTKMMVNTEERILTMWLGRQRNLYWGRLKGYKPLSKERVLLLESIGIDWKGDRSFNDKLEELDFWLRVNNGEYPKYNRLNKEESVLYYWISNIKNKIKKGDLEPEKVSLLKKYDFYNYF